MTGTSSSLFVENLSLLLNSKLRMLSLNECVHMSRACLYDFTVPVLEKLQSLNNNVDAMVRLHRNLVFRPFLSDVERYTDKGYFHILCVRITDAAHGEKKNGLVASSPWRKEKRAGCIQPMELETVEKKKN